MSNATERAQSLIDLAAARAAYLAIFDTLITQATVSDGGGGKVPKLKASALEIGADELVLRARHVAKVHLPRG